jgi:hypothetical protein
MLRIKQGRPVCYVTFSTSGAARSRAAFLDQSFLNEDDCQKSIPEGPPQDLNHQ